MFAVDLTDSKNKGSLPTCSSLPCTTYDSPLLRLFQVNNGVWSCLDYVEDIYWSSSPPFFKSLTQTFWFYRSHIYLTTLAFTTTT